MKDKTIKRIALGGILAAATILLTTLVSIPIPGGLGFVNLGDAGVLTAAFLLGGPWGALCGGAASALSDLLLGYGAYAPATFLIKGGMALFLGTFVKHCDTWKKCFVVAAIAEGIMVLGYFIFDLVVFAQYSIAAQEIPVNLAQGLVCGALGAVLIRYLPQQIKRARGEEKRRVH